MSVLVGRFRFGLKRIALIDWVFPFLIVLLNLAFFSEALFSDLTFFARDVSTFHYPLKKLVTESYARGEWPLWNPYIQMGQPLLANPNAMAVYPTQLLFQLLPFETAFELHFVLHLMVAGIATFILARRLGLEHLPAFLTAILYNFSGVTLSFVNLFNIIPVVAFLPLLALAFLALCQEQTWRNLSITGFLLACFFLVLEPLSSIAIALFLLILVVAKLLNSRCTGIVCTKVMLSLALAVVLGLSLAAIQILPTWELVNDSGRRSGLGFGEVAFWSFSPLALLQGVCPRILGDYFSLDSPTPWATRFLDNREPYLLSCYVGIVPLLLATWGIISGWRKYWIVRWLVAIGLLMFILALGKNTALYSWLFQWLPVFRYGRFPVKFLVGVNLCLALLAGFGLSCMPADVKLLQRGNSGLKLIAAFGFLAVVLCIVTALRFDLVWSYFDLARIKNDQFSFQWFGCRAQIDRSLVIDAVKHLQVQLAMCFPVFLLSIWNKSRSGLVGFALAVWLAFDLFTSNLWINPLIKAEFFDAPTVTRYLLDRAREEGIFRVYRLEPERLRDHPGIYHPTNSVVWLSYYRKETLYPFLSAKDHIQYALFQSIDRLETSPVQKLIRSLAQAGTIDDKVRVLAGLNVRFLISPVEVTSPKLRLEALVRVNSEQPMRVYRLIGSLPRAFLIPLGGTDVRGGHDHLRHIEQSDLLQTPLGSAHVISYAPSHIELELHADRSCELVLLDSYTKDWRGQVDGKEAVVHRIDESYRGMLVQPGVHRATLRYEPASFSHGLLISCLTLLVWILTSIVWLVWNARTRRPDCEFVG